MQHISYTVPGMGSGPTTALTLHLTTGFFSYNSKITQNKTFKHGSVPMHVFISEVLTSCFMLNP